MAKKRALPAQSSTLHDFFSRAPATSSKPSGSGSTGRGKGIVTGRQRASPAKRLRLDPEETICIDLSSDEEEAVLLPPSENDRKGKRRAEERQDRQGVVIDQQELETLFVASSSTPSSQSSSSKAEIEDGVLESSCLEWEARHPPLPLSTSPLLPDTTDGIHTLRPTLHLAALATDAPFSAGPFTATDGTEIKEPVEEEEVYDDGGWNAEDDEQGSQLDPEDEDDDELTDLGDNNRGLGDGSLKNDREIEDDVSGVVLAEDYDDNEQGPHCRSSSPFRPITSIKHHLPAAAPAASPPLPKRDAFSLLMARNKKSDVWQAVEDDQSLKRGGKVMKHGERRKAPFFKVLTGMPVAVDAFRYGKVPGVTAYLLSHAHSDHYTKLSKAWQNGPIYCSQTTANLIIRNLGVGAKWVKPIPYDVPFEMPNTNGIIVTMISANHCPGSSIFLFEGKRTVHAGDSPYPAKFVGSPRVWRYLHCGDFRACPKHILHPAVARGKLDEVYLDTTYLNPQYCFAPQRAVIEGVSQLAKQIVSGQFPFVSGKVVAAKGTLASKATMSAWISKDLSEADRQAKEERERVKGDKTLVVVGTYSIGKERIVKGIALALRTKIYCDARKRALIFDQTDDPELLEMITANPKESQVHMIPLRDISPEDLQIYLKRHQKDTGYERILGFRPTGWTYTPTGGTLNNPDIPWLLERDRKATFDAQALQPMRGSSEQVMMFGVPYSEHSSFFELTCFALSVPGEPRWIATVNVGSQKSREKMDAWFKRWAAEKKKREASGRGGLIEYRSIEHW